MAEPDVPPSPDADRPAGDGGGDGFGRPSRSRRYQGQLLGLPPAGPGSLASIWQRLGGLVIDSLILAPLSALAGLFGAPDADPAAAASTTGHPVAFVASLFVFAVGAVYTVGLIGWRGRTWGEGILGLKVIRVSDRRIPGYEIAGRRWAVIGALTFIGTLVAYFDAPAAVTFLAVLALAQLLVLGWAVWDPNRQGLHDKFAGTIVIRDTLVADLAPDDPYPSPPDPDLGER